jgi:hypothetical protein
VPLKLGELGVLEKMTHLCEAMRPPEITQKLSALKKLEDSGDSVLEKEARAAGRKTCERRRATRKAEVKEDGWAGASASYRHGS